MNYVDRQGRQTRPSHWVDVPAATRHSNGISHIEAYVARVLASKSKSSWVNLSTKSGNTAIGVAQHDGKVSLGLTLNVRRERKREAAIREFFASRNIAPGDDYLAKDGDIPDSTRVLNFPMPRNSSAIAEMASHLLRDIYRLRDATTLDMRFEEYEAS